MLISVSDWQKHAHLRDRRTYNAKDERRRNLFATGNNNIKQLVAGCQKTKKPSMLAANIVNVQKETETNRKKWNMKRCKFTQTRLVEYFATNMRNTNLLGVNSKDLSESFCLIVTKFFFTTTSLSSLIRYDFMFLSLWSVANWRRATLLSVFMVVSTSAGCGPGVSRSRLSRSTAYHYFTKTWLSHVLAEVSCIIIIGSAPVKPHYSYSNAVICSWASTGPRRSNPSPVFAAVPPEFLC